MSAARRTRNRPPVSSAQLSANAVDDVAATARQILENEYCLRIPLRYIVVVEGGTDVAYLERAAKLCQDQFGVDLLSLTEDQQDFPERITICTPVNPKDPERKRGGTPWVIRLAEDLREYVFRYDIVGPACFVLDHDVEGIRTQVELLNLGYSQDRARAITLDHSEHLGACRLAGKGDDPIVIEDLLSLGVQKTYFDVGEAYCDVAYEQGQMVRIGWRSESKSALCDHVCTTGSFNDVCEIVRLLVRIRRMWRLDVPAVIEDAIEDGRCASV